MSVPLPYLGETIVANMVVSLRTRFLRLANLAERSNPRFVESPESQIAFTEVRLCPYSGRAFDGASRVDLVVLLDETLGVPFEVKLGETRLNKSRIDDDWLNGCDISHDRTRFKGNMMSILERKFPVEAEQDDLRVQLNDAATVTLTDDWYIIARRQVLLSWQGEKMPAFSPRVRFLAFEDVVAEFGGEQPFNHMVKQTLDFNYYAEWGVGD